MQNNSLTLFLEIDHLNLNFFVTKNKDYEYKVDSKVSCPIDGIENNKITNLEKVLKLIKNNIFSIEQKYNCTFKNIIIILENFNLEFINLTGFKKLNKSQILRENITYIINTLKSYIDKNESKKNILHIFNSKFLLDGEEVENLPIGLFCDFYSHELSFSLMNKNDNKNIKNIFEKCNLKVKKILLKSFVKGAHLSDNYNLDTFFVLKINEYNSKIFFFENCSLKFEQDFRFGYHIILKDISKITSLKINTVKNILNKIEFKSKIKEDELLPKELFLEENFRKIKKKLIYEIAISRIIELSEIIMTKNVNLKYFVKLSKILFFEYNDEFKLNCLKSIFEKTFLSNGILDFKALDKMHDKSMLETAGNIVHFGWKKEAIPVTQTEKSLIRRFFDALFG